MGGRARGRNTNAACPRYTIAKRGRVGRGRGDPGFGGPGASDSQPTVMNMLMRATGAHVEQPDVMPTPEMPLPVLDTMQEVQPAASDEAHTIGEMTDVPEVGRTASPHSGCTTALRPLTRV